MEKRDQNGQLKIVGWVLLALALSALMLFVAGIAHLAERAFDSFFGRTYQFRSIGDVLHFHDPRFKLLSWDHSFLLLAGAFIIGWLINRLSEFFDWLERSPEERQRERDRRRKAQQEATKALNEQQRIEREKKVERKASKKPMSGWRRMWIVCSILFGVPACALAYDINSRASASVSWQGDNAAFWRLAESSPELSSCDWSTANAGEAIAGTSFVTCRTKDPFTPALLWAFLPAVFMALVGLTVRWIYRGFRQPQSAKQ